MVYIEKHQRTKKKTEKSYQVALAKELNGILEVQTITGTIDILTSTQLIEVKIVHKWKEALGQILAYALSYPSYEKKNTSVRRDTSWLFKNS